MSNFKLVPPLLKCPKAFSILSRCCDLKKEVDDGEVLVGSWDIPGFFNIPIRDFQKSHPGIFRDFLKPISRCFLRLFTQFVDENKLYSPKYNSCQFDNDGKLMIIPKNE